MTDSWTVPSSLRGVSVRLGRGLFGVDASLLLLLEDGEEGGMQA